MAVVFANTHERLPLHIQDFIFVRELSEVYLLVDHISGRWDKSLSGTSAGDLKDDVLGPHWLEDICEIGFPPSGTNIEQAKQAATLLRVKDRLNARAAPASGTTIAFTLLVAGEDNRSAPDHNTTPGAGWWSWLLALLQREPEETVLVGGASPSPGGGHDAASGRVNAAAPPSRTSLARMAYPGLVSPAWRFKWNIRLINVLLVLWLGLTCMLSWDISAGQAISTQFKDLKARRSAIVQAATTAGAPNIAKDQNAIPAAVAPATSGAIANSPTPASSAASLEGAAQTGAELLKSCHWRSEAAPSAEKKGTTASRYFSVSENNPTVDNLTSVNAIQLCSQLGEYWRDYAAARENLADWLEPWQWVKAVSHHYCSGACLKKASFFDERDANEEWAGVLLQVLASAVLPLFYGFLGAGAAVVRNLWGRMRDSLLSPRDLTLAGGQLALGAVIGACIGLFVTPSGSGSDAQAAAGITGSIVLTASALSFIAGFGVEGVFVALESFIRRLFNLPEAPKVP